jgi:alkylation response protein AidB-like acyl-CoA dehydrogenase
MIKDFPSDQGACRAMLLGAIDAIAPVLRASGARSEELGTLAPEAVAALRDNGMFRLKLVHEMGGAGADPMTEMLVLEGLAYHDLTSAWCTMVGATAIASLGMFLIEPGLQKVFAGGLVPTAAISFFPAGRAKREGDGFRLSGRWRFFSGIRHSEWAVGGTVVEGTEAENGGRPLVIFSAFPTRAGTIHDNWGGVTGLRGTGSSDLSLEDYPLPKEMTFVWDLLQPKPLRGGPSALLPPFSYVAKEHGSVAIGAARRALDELIQIATTTQGTFRPTKLADRQVVHRKIAEADIKIRAARALMHERYQKLYDDTVAGRLPEGRDIADVRAICVHATEVAMETAAMAFHFAGNTGLHHPHVIGRLLRDLNVAGIHQVMSDTAWENHGKFRMGLPSDPLA